VEVDCATGERVKSSMVGSQVRKSTVLTNSEVKNSMMQSVAVKHGKGTLKEMIADRDLLANLIIMAFIWSITAFAYYLGKYQVTAVAGDVYVNSVTSSISDIISRPIGLVLYRYMTARKVIIVFFTISLIGVIPVTFGEAGSETY